MKTLHIIAAALVLASAARASDIKVIVAGQSNAVGYCPGTVDANPAVLAYDPAQGKYVTAVDCLPFWESQYPGYRGPWVTLGKLLLKQYNHVYLTGGGHGGEPISYWDVGQPGWTALAANIAASGTDAQFFIWYQGESDASPLNTAYAANLAALIARVRALTNNPTLPALIVQLEDQPGVAGWPEIQAAQYAYVTSDDHAFLIQTIGFPVQAGSVPHLTGDGYDMVARACAKQMLGATWFKGDKGDQGLLGLQGAQGPQGPQGWKGDKGDTVEPPAGSVLLMQHGASTPDGGYGFLKSLRVGRLMLDVYQK